MRIVMNMCRLGLVFAMAAFACLPPAFAQTITKLVVYSALEADHIDSYRKAFEADNPDIVEAIHHPPPMARRAT